jgi:hypothetical protein
MATYRPRAARTVTALVVAAAISAACGSAPPSTVPTATQAPLVTPNPHLPSPATAQQVFSGLGKAGIRITANTASLGAEGSDVVTKIYATYLGWPLDVTQYTTSSALTRVTKWPAGEAPGRGEPPIALAGHNILITWGPTVSGAKPDKPEGRQSDGLRELVAALDVLLSPLRARTNVPVAITGQTAVAPSPGASTAP